MSRRAAPEVSFWKEQVCVNCGTVFRYLVKRPLPAALAAGLMPAALAAGLSEQGRKALARNRGRGNDLAACPVCGCYQADMVAARRAWLHGLWLGITVPVPVVVLLVLAGFDLAGDAPIIWIAGGVALLALIGHFLIDLSDPNRNSEANRGRALARQEAGTLEQLPAGGGAAMTPGPAGEPRPAGRAVAYLLFLLAVLAVASSELVRVARGWPLNEDWHPPVLGPGDTAYVYFPRRLPSVKGLWSSQGARAEIVNAQQFGLAHGRLEASSKQDTWGGTIGVKEAEKTGNARVWLRATLPASESLQGKEVQLQMQLDVVYPRIRGPNQFEDRRTSLTHTASIRLASPGAGSLYRLLWWVGLLGGGAAVVFLSVALLQSARTQVGQAPATAIYPVGTADAT